MQHILYIQNWSLKDTNSYFSYSLRKQFQKLNHKQQSDSIQTQLNLNYNQWMFLTRNILKAFTHSNNKEKLNQLNLTLQKVQEDYRKTLKRRLEPEVHTKLNMLIKTMQDIAFKKKQLLQQQQKEQQLKIVKDYLSSKVVQPTKIQESRYIPVGMTLNKLQHKGNTVLLVGIDKTNEQHGFFVQDLVKRLEIQLMMTQIPPDWPYFIKTTYEFQTSWKRFITLAQQFSFYLNPTPTTISEVIMDSSKIPLFKDTLLRSQSFMDITRICLQMDPNTKKFQTNSFLSGLYCPKLQNMLCFDYPILRQRQYQAINMSINSLRDLFKTYLYNISDKNSKNFDPRLLHYQKMLKPKIQYMSRLIKLGSLMYPKTLAVCDHQYSHMICEEWKIPQPINNAEIFKFAGEKNIINEKKSRSFLEHIEKLIILDVMLGPMVTDFFIKYKTFPYRCQKFIGREQLKPSLEIIWDFYLRNYKDAVKNNGPVQYPGQSQKS